jgi:hypothetical protein
MAEGNNNQTGQGSYRQKAIKRPTLITPYGIQGAIETSGFEGILEDAIVVTVTVRGRMEQITFHQPVGITPLPADAVVGTISSEIRLLIARKEDERRKAIDKDRNLRVTTLFAGTAGEVAIVDDGRLKVAGTDVFRAIANHEVARKKQWRREHPAPVHTAEQLARPKGQRGKLPKPSMAPKAFIEDGAPNTVGNDVRGAYGVKARLEAWKNSEAGIAAKEAADQAIPYPAFETKGGPAGNRSQKESGFYRSIPPDAAAIPVDRLVGWLLSDHAGEVND